jgi:predicted ATP-dependent serine protease
MHCGCPHVSCPAPCVLPHQLRECGTALLRLAKDHGITVFAIGHVTKESELAGPKVGRCVIGW